MKKGDLIAYQNGIRISLSPQTSALMILEESSPNWRLTDASQRVVSHRGHQVRLLKTNKGGWGFQITWNDFMADCFRNVNPLYLSALASPQCSLDTARSIVLKILKEEFPK